MSDGKKIKLHVISHTHWDRAWYMTFQEFRFKLVQMTDTLLNILDTVPEYKSFHFDGQTVVLDDYTLIRPEKTTDLKKYIEQDRIVIGPWYVLNDEFIVSGESTIRNLLIGKQVGEKYGKVSTAGYVPDPFGHIIQLPQILNGFGIDTFIFTRGMDERLEETGCEFIWQGPDGSEVTAINQKNGYCNGGSLGCKEVWYSDVGNIAPDNARALERIRKTIKTLSEYSSLKNSEVIHILLNNGCDHLIPQKELPDMLKYAEEKLENTEIVHTTFDQYLREITAHRDRFKTITGEIRSGRYQALLNGVWSARTYLKQLNCEAQAMLELQAEPTGIIAEKLAGVEYPQPYFTEAWKLLLKNHPHDNICGCSIDEVHREMVHQFEMPIQIGRQSVSAAQKDIARRVSHEVSGKSVPIVVFNQLAYKRSELIERIVQIPKDLYADGYILEDEAGNAVPFWLKHTYFAEKTFQGYYDKELEYGPQKAWFTAMTESVNDFKYTGLSEKTDLVYLDIAFYAEDVPAAGYKTYILRKGTARQNPPSMLDTETWEIENEFIRVKVNDNGTFCLTDKNTGRKYESLNLLADVEDAGDEYDYSHVKNSKTFYSANCQGSTAVLENSPMAVRIVTDFIFEIPSQLDSSRESRSSTRAGLPVSVEITVNRYSPRVDIKTTIENCAKDHRMRAMFPTPVKAETIHTSTAFGIIERSVKCPAGKDYLQIPLPTLPQQGFSSVEDAQGGLLIHNKGLIEIEPVESPEGIIPAVTLFRSVGWLSRGDALNRPYNVGPALPAPEAQCLGTQVFYYAVEPFSGSCYSSAPFRNLQYAAPLTVTVPDYTVPELPLAESLIEIDNTRVLQSALKRNELTGNVCLRLYNPSPADEQVSLKLGIPVKDAWITDMKEERIKPAEVSGQLITLNIPAYKIVTLEIAV